MFELDPEATFVHVRDYYYDWQAADPATFVIDRLDDVPAPERPTTPIFSPARICSPRCSMTPLPLP